MHELSIVMGIIGIASEEARKAQSATIEEVELDIGSLSGVEPYAFDFAWQQGVKNTLLQNAVLKINRPEGKGRCLECDTVFPVGQLFDACPACGGHWIDILQGKEMRVRSVVIS
jgi:hydrogenase nickel incorporation protein HypA/HybF